MIRELFPLAKLILIIIQKKIVFLLRSEFSWMFLAIWNYKSYEDVL